MELRGVIRGFECVRADGRVIHESITPDVVASLGWAASKVVEVRWRWQAQRLKLVNHLGMQAVVLPGRQRLAVLWNHDASGSTSTLYLVDGATQQLDRVPDQITINGDVEDGAYSLFESSAPDLSSAFSCIYRRSRDNEAFRVDVDVATGSLLAVTSVAR